MTTPTNKTKSHMTDNKSILFLFKLVVCSFSTVMASELVQP